MKLRNVTAFSLLLIGILLLFPERNRSQGKASESRTQPQHEDAAPVADNTEPAASSQPSQPSTPAASRAREKTPANLIRAAESLESIIQDALSKLGFSQNDIDVAMKEMLSEYLDGDNRVDISRVVNTISESMKLDAAQHHEFNIAMINVYVDSLRISFDQWSQCLAIRTAKSTECLKDVAQDLSRTVAAGLSGPDWSKEEFTLSYSLVERFVEEAAVKCRESKEMARIALQLNHLDCPL